MGIILKVLVIRLDGLSTVCSKTLIWNLDSFHKVKAWAVGDNLPLRAVVACELRGGENARRSLANENKRKADVENVEFLKGEIEHIPLPDDSVDVIISNCVINLSADKDRVLREAFRVLKPGGRFAVSDVVTRGEMLPEIRQSVLLWVGCLAGALEQNEYRTKLAAAGFEKIEIEPTSTPFNPLPSIVEVPTKATAGIFC